MYGGDEIGALVLDVGSHTLKLGYAGEDTPKAVFSSAAGYIDEPDMDSSSLSSPPPKRRCYVGRDASYRRDGLQMSSAVSHSVITDWEGVERLLSHTLRSHLSLSPQEHPMLWAEPTGGSREQRERMLSLLMESEGVPAVFFCKAAVLSAFAAGRSTALVCESGAGVTTVAPVHEGYVLTKGIRRTKIAGNTLDSIAQQLIFAQQTAAASPSLSSSSSSPSSLFSSQPIPLYAIRRSPTASGSLSSSSLIPAGTTPSFHQFAQQELVRDVKETVCRLSETPFDVNGTKYPSVQYELPDGQQLEIGNERFLVPEHLFQPALANPAVRYEDEFDPAFTFTGLQHMVSGTHGTASLRLAALPAADLSAACAAASCPLPSCGRQWSLWTWTCTRSCTRPSSCPAARLCWPASLLA